MASRDNILAAFSSDGVSPEQNFPAVLIYEDIVYRDHCLSMTRTPWWHRLHHDRSLQLEHLLERTTTFGQDWVDIHQFGHDYTIEQRSQIHVSLENGQVVRRNLTDGMIKFIEPPKISGEHITTPSIELRDEAHVDAIIPLVPSSESITDSPRNSLLADVLKAVPHLFRVARCSAPVWTLACLIGYENYLVESITRPTLLMYACRRLLHNTIHDIERAAFAGADGIFIEECFTDMLSPASYEEIVVPIAIELHDAIRSLGMKSVLYFTGNPAGKLDLLKKTRPDGFAFEESKKNFSNDIVKLAQYFGGSFTLFGNVDSVGVIENGSRDALVFEMKRQLVAARLNKNRFVFSQGSPITPGTADGRIAEFFELAHQIEHL